MSVGGSILSSVLANMLTTLLYTVVIAAVIGAFLLSQRRRLFRLFGIGRYSPALRVYLSRLQVSEYDGPAIQEVRHGYVGPVMLRMEYLGAEKIVYLFRKDWIGRSPRGLLEWLQERVPHMAAVQVKIDSCPDPEREALFEGALLIIGSGIYNGAAERYLDRNPETLFRFVRDGSKRGVEIAAGSRRGTRIWGRGSDDEDRELGIVQRLYDRDQGRTVIICAGFGTSATYLATRYLADNWRTLARRAFDRKAAAYGRNVGVLLAFPKLEANVHDEDRLTRWVITPADVLEELPQSHSS